VTDDLSSTVGIVALAAGVVALGSLLIAALLWRKLGRIQAAQRVVLGESSEQDLVAHAHRLQETFNALQAMVETGFANLDARVTGIDERLTRAITRAAVVRYDAYGEMSGRQSSSIALLDETGTGIVMSSILHRDQARLYAKGIRNGEPEFQLSPEETEAIEVARRTAVAAPVEEQKVEAGETDAIEEHGF
jgi:hypothetical protein